MRLDGSLFTKLLWREAWFIALRRWDQPSAPFHFLVAPFHHFYADPLLYKKGSSLFVFFEDYVHVKRKGVISFCEIHADGSFGRVSQCLERPYHLSYPFIFDWNGEIYMMPESSGNRSVELFRADPFPHKWSFDRTLMADLRLVDSTLVEANGRYWMFAAKGYDQLHVFHADSPLGPWSPHKGNPVVVDLGSARPAGRILSRDGRLVRPVQDCSVRYGRRIKFMEIDELTPSSYRQHEVGMMITEEWLPHNLATHTYDVAGDFEVVDALYRTRRWERPHPERERQQIASFRRPDPA